MEERDKLIVLPQFVETRWNNKNKEWLANMGYEFSKIGEMISVYVLDLQERSNTNIEINCDYCATTIIKKYSDYNIMKKNATNDACKNCKGIKITASKISHTIEKIKKDFELRDFNLLSTQYDGYGKYLEYRCSSGHVSRITYKNFLKGRGCKECAHINLGKNRRIPMNDVNQLFLDSGCHAC